MARPGRRPPAASRRRRPPAPAGGSRRCSLAPPRRPGRPRCSRGKLLRAGGRSTSGGPSAPLAPCHRRGWSLPAPPTALPPPHGGGGGGPGPRSSPLRRLPPRLPSASPRRAPPPPTVPALRRAGEVAAAAAAPEGSDFFFWMPLAAHPRRRPDARLGPAGPRRPPTAAGRWGTGADPEGRRGDAGAPRPPRCASTVGGRGTVPSRPVAVCHRQGGPGWADGGGRPLPLLPGTEQLVTLRPRTAVFPERIFFFPLLPRPGNVIANSKMLGQIRILPAPPASG